MSRHAIFASLPILLLAAACATPTPYKPYTNGEGLTTGSRDGISYSLFAGNSATSAERAKRFSRLGAIETCLEKKQLTFMGKALDFSQSLTHFESSTTSTPVSSYNGTTNYVSSTSTYPVTTTYPRYVIGFTCTDHVKIMEGNPSLEYVSRDLVTPITGDFRGGILIKNSNESPVLKDDDVIISVDKHRVGDANDLRDAMFQTKSDKVPFGIIRNKKIQKVKVTLKDASQVVVAENIEDVRKACAILGTGEEIKICNALKTLTAKAAEKKN